MPLGPQVPMATVLAKVNQNLADLVSSHFIFTEPATGSAHSLDPAMGKGLPPVTGPYRVRAQWMKNGKPVPVVLRFDGEVLGLDGKRHCLWIYSTANHGRLPEKGFRPASLILEDLNTLSILPPAPS